ncbi:MAG TPA: sugar kinase [Flavobacteriales bacterium]|nr:sugar kinase [Flavobacteriales bacterium]
MSLLTIGTVAFDTIETPFGKAEKIIGGSASYISTSASYFVDYSNIVAVVGEDFPAEALGRLRDRNVDLQGLQIKTGEKSFFWAGKYHIDMNSRDTLDTQLNVLASFDPILPDAYQNSEFLMLGNLSPDVQLKVIKRLQKRPKLIVLDTMNYWMDNNMDDLEKVMAKIDVLSINDEEARQLSGEFSLTKAARKILQMGPNYLIIKKGEHGALLFNEKEAFFAPALPLEDVFDPTGAGDTFAGGFIGYLAQTDDISFANMKRAVIYGSAMASFCVEKFGLDRMWELKKSEVNDRVQQFIDLVQFEIKLD